MGTNAGGPACAHENEKVSRGTNVPASEVAREATLSSGPADTLPAPKGRMPAGSVTASEAARRLGVSITPILARIYSGRLAATRAGRRWAIAETDLKPLFENGVAEPMPADAITAAEAARRLGVSITPILARIYSGRLSAVRVGPRWAIAETDLQSLNENGALESTPAGAVTATEAARRLGVQRSSVVDQINRGTVFATRAGRRWAIAETDLQPLIDSYAAAQRPVGAVTAAEAARRLGVHRDWVLRRIKGGTVSAVRDCHGWAIGESDLESLADMHAAARLPGGTVGVPEAARRLGITRAPVLEFIHRGRLPASRAGYQWAIRETDLQSLIEKRAVGLVRREPMPTPPGTVAVVDAARRLGISPKGVRALIHRGRVPAIRVGQRRAIAETDLQSLMERRAAGPTPAGTVSTVEAAKRLGVTRPRVSHLISAGRLRASRVGHHQWAIAETDLQPLIDERQSRISRRGTNRRS